MGDFFNREKMWFGTERKMGWIETPMTGADVSPIGFGTSTTGLNGFGYVRNSWDSHKNYQFGWGESADLGLASKIHAYRNGTYGRGLIYFHDPMYYGTNILPRRLADPSMAINHEAEPLIQGLWPRSTPTPNNTNDLPVETAIYDVPAGYDSEASGGELFVPIPPGFTLYVGSVYSSSGSASLYFRTPSGRTNFTQSSRNTLNLHPQNVSGEWARIGIQNPGGVKSAISLSAVSARLVPPGESANVSGPWMSGEGNSGCQFVGSPTLINYNGVNGGQVGIACTLAETGAWE